MFIAKDYDLRLDAPACEPGSEYWNATAWFEDDISEVFPYLNAQWKGVIYSPEAQQMTWKHKGRAVALKAHEITISSLPDRDAATIAMEEIVAEINRIWMDRESLTPLYISRKRLVAMEIYQLLPQTNCRSCGQATCFAFASKLTVAEVQIEDCTPLFSEEQYEDRRMDLLDMLAKAA